MTGAPPVVLDVLGVPIAVAPTVAAQFAHLRRSTEPAQFAVKSTDPGVALAELTLIGAENSPLLCMHAGVVAGPAGFLAVPGQSGLGKTTLVAALMQCGFGYVSDESLAIDRGTGLAQSFARPLGLAAAVWPMLGLDASTPPPPPGGEKLIAPEVFGPVAAESGRVRDIVLAHREPGPLRLEPTARGPAVSALLRRAFNHYRAPEASFRAVVALVRAARVWEASYESAPEFARSLAATISRY